MNVTQLIQTTKMKLKAKTLIRKFIEIESLKDNGGMEPELAKECAVVAIGYFEQWFTSHSIEILKEIIKLHDEKQPVNYATKDGVIL